MGYIADLIMGVERTTADADCGGHGGVLNFPTDIPTSRQNLLPGLSGQISARYGRLRGNHAPSEIEYDIYRQVAKHPTFSLAMLALIGPILASSWQVEADDGVPDYIKNFIASHMQQIRPSLLKGVLTSGKYGWSAFEKVFGTGVVNGETRIIYKKLKWLLPDATKVLEDGDKSGRFWGIRHHGKGGTRDVQADYSYVYTWNLEGGDWYGTDFPAELARPYTERSEAEDRRADRYSERIAGVIPMIFYPPGSSKDPNTNETIDHATLAYQMLDDLQMNNRGIAIPNLTGEVLDPREKAELQGKSQWYATVLDLGENLAGAFNERKADLDKFIVRSTGNPERRVLEANGSASRADSVTADDIGLLASTLLDADIARSVSWYLANPLLVYNFGARYENAVRLKPAPLVDDRKEMFRALATAAIQNPQIIPDAAGWVKWVEVFQGANIPVDQVKIMRSVDDINRAMGLLDDNTDNLLTTQSDAGRFVPRLPASPLPGLPVPAVPAQASVAAPPVNTQVASDGALNGAQISSAVTVLQGVTAGTISTVAAIELLVALGISRERAVTMVNAQRGMSVPPPIALPAPFAGNGRLNGG